MNFVGNINQKLPKTGVSIFSKMSKLAREHDAINLSQGFPDFSPEKDLVKLVNKHMKKGHNQYAPMAGVLQLREAIASKTESLYGAVYNPENEITVFPGATLAIYATITALIKSDDEVLLIDPAYDCYAPAVELSGGVAIRSSLVYPNYNINWEDIKKRLSIRTKMIVVNSPHNPTGSTLLKSDLEELKKLVAGTDIVILSDEVYEHMVYDDQKHCSLAADEELRSRTVVISSFGKTYHTTGWKMGYAVAPENIMKPIQTCYQYMAFSTFTPAQYAYAEYLKFEEKYLNLDKFYQQKRDVFRQFVDSSKFTILPCRGTYFQLLGYENISEEGDIEFAEKLTQEFGIAAIPTSVFYNDKTDQKVLRFCFAKSQETLEKAAEVLCKI